ncbi:hypothetical protein BN940_17176 [Castellaniella defragrans 65Phen]|uniref:Uncharacterized protein n=1 Tax=Castellaniella defragrans (strain DSM 12143 / CCUG 39792 / 65Phen) TaxID=1437824 RepID=W8X195_CASD6|nr:hypothetical protein BN940_17176 [Castellaniella defragrans 65Phen]
MHHIAFRRRMHRTLYDTTLYENRAIDLMLQRHSPVRWSIAP